jgi:hypothetical protein
MAWSSPCQQLAGDLQADGYAYTADGATINWTITAVNGIDSLLTYGQLVTLGGKLSHLSYVEAQADSTQAASDLLLQAWVFSGIFQSRCSR